MLSTGIAAGVAFRVVERLEIVDVEYDGNEVRAPVQLVLDQPVEPFLNESAVREHGEWIDLCIGFGL